ncbi:ABC transporter permease [Thermodesulfovibrionales bacterium]|nr:ABC transporter permease [Thermodesulfovibrionales bacterium]
MTLMYSFKSAFKSFWREKGINTLSAFAVASSLLIITLVFLFLYNASVAAERIPEQFSMVVYLEDNLSWAETDYIIDTLEKKSGIRSLKYISADDALDEIRQALRDPYILKGIKENPLSPTIELRLKDDFVTPSLVKQISEEIAKIDGVGDIYYGEEIAEAIHLLKSSLQGLSIIIFLMLSAGVIFAVYTTIKILLYRKKEEIEILKLLGATKGFIRMPFLVEGSTIGSLGGAIGAIGILVFYFAIVHNLSPIIPILKSLIFPFEILIALPITGALLGIIGSVIAIGRLKP